VGGSFPHADRVITFASGSPDEFYTAVAVTPKRLVWTVQSASGANTVDGVQARCLRDLPL
jgi:hypothetical protein